jgi:hypothetical protein
MDEQFLEVYAHERSQFTDARYEYMYTPPDVPPWEVSPGNLHRANRILQPLESPMAQTMRGWVNLEWMFHFGNNEAGRLGALRRSHDAFSRAHNSYSSANQQLQVGRLMLAAAALPSYERFAANEPVDSETQLQTLASMAQASSSLLDASEASARRSEVRQSHIEILLIMASIAKHNDTRKPMPTWALPATLRQRVGFFPTAVQKEHGRYNWDVTLLDYNPQEKWNMHGGLRVMHGEERREVIPLHGDITPVTIHELVGVADEGLALRSAVADMAEAYRNGKPKGEQRAKVSPIVRRVSTVTTKRHIPEFAATPVTHRQE